MSTIGRPNCLFCQRLVTGVSNEPWDKVLAETEKFVIVPTKGSLVPGWLLVVSKRHVLCSGGLSLSEFEPLQQAIGMAVRLVEQGFGPATIFEHGPAFTGAPLGCGINHLHFHVAPLRFSLVDAINLMIPAAQWRSITNLAELAPLHRNGVGYAMVREPNDAVAWFQPPADLRQPLRRAIANRLGTPASFDYSTHPYKENVLHTLERVSAGI